VYFLELCSDLVNKRIDCVVVVGDGLLNSYVVCQRQTNATADTLFSSKINLIKKKKRKRSNLIVDFCLCGVLFEKMSKITIQVRSYCRLELRSIY